MDKMSSNLTDVIFKILKGNNLGQKNSNAISKIKNRR
uniref:Uncharacterized protein n=1 Tax=Arundo donax TaxID=35708 RepID=A0A0A8ZUQ4_ARUDO